MPGHRIVSLIASATEIVAALGFEEQLVGRSHECDFPASVERVPVCSSSKVGVGASSRAIDAQVQAIVSEALSVYRVDAELLDRLAPTVIITQTQCEVCAVSLADVEQAVCELASSQPEIVALEPMRLGDIWRDITAVAVALDASEGGAQLLRQLTGRLEAIRAKAALSPSRPTIACIEWIDPLMHAENWLPELVDIAGGTIMMGETGHHSGYFEIQELGGARSGCCGDHAVRLRHLPGRCTRCQPWRRAPSGRNSPPCAKGRCLLPTATSTSIAPDRELWSRPKFWPNCSTLMRLTSGIRNPDGYAGTAHPPSRGICYRVPTRFVLKYTLRARLESSGPHEAVEGRTGHARELGDGGLGNAQLEEAPDVVLLAVESRDAQRALRAPSFRPEALALARPSRVRSEIRSRSTSANSAKRVVMTLVWMSRWPSMRMFSFIATKATPAVARASRMATI